MKFNLIRHEFKSTHADSEGRDPKRTRMMCAGTIAARKINTHGVGSILGAHSGAGSTQWRCRIKLVKKTNLIRQGRFSQKIVNYIKNRSIRFLILSVRASENMFPSKI